MALGDSLRTALSVIRGNNNTQYQNVTWSSEFTATVLGLSVEELWRTQPYLRTVVTFLARNIAQLGLHSFERVSETDRRRLRDDPIALLMRRPNDRMTTYELVFALVADLALYDEAVWLVLEDAKAPSGWIVQPLSPSWVTRRGGGSVFGPDWIEFTAPGAFRPTRVDMKDVLWFHGWNPGSPATASSPVTALKQLLAEQIYAQVYRQQIWQKGGRIGGVLSRPAGNKWDPKVRERFQRQWQAKWAGNDGSMAGGTPILEDGMTYQQVGFSAHEDEYVEGSKLSFATVASVYHVNPTMVGLLDDANFSNVREFRKMLYGDTLGSTISMIEDRINGFLVPKVSPRETAYVEFNIAEKLQGNFEEQAAALSTSVGRPWMTADEARALSNMPSLGGDAERLVTPLNVLIGGQSSPRDSGSQNEAGKSAKNVGELPNVKAFSVKAETPSLAGWQAKSAEVFDSFFTRQRARVLSVLGAKADQDWWDTERWNKELADDLYALAVSAATGMGREQAEALGFTADGYNEDQTLAFLLAVAESRADMVNATTRDRIQKALDAGSDPAAVFDEAKSARAGSAGFALAAALSGFALIEAAKQTVGEQATKTWNVNSRNPRSSHSRLNGESVPVGEKFSNGADWPGDPVLGAEGVSNCRCGVTITY